MTEITVNDLTIELMRGDIANQADCQAVVNAANAELRIGGGVAGAIHRGAGPGLEEETRPLAPIRPGEAVITGAHELANEYVIHCLGPVYGRDHPEEKLLADCYWNAVQLAEENEITSVAFPAISTGAFGYPMEAAARVAFNTIQSEIPNLKHLQTIRFVLWGEQAMQVHQTALNDVFSESGG